MCGTYMALPWEALWMNQIVPRGPERHFGGGRGGGDGQYWKPGKTKRIPEILAWGGISPFSESLRWLVNKQMGSLNRFQGTCPNQADILAGKGFGTVLHLPHCPPSSSFIPTRHPPTQWGTQVKHGVIAVSFYAGPETLPPSKCWQVSCLLSDCYNTENSFI